MLTSPGFLWMLMMVEVCALATVTWPDAPAAAAAWDLSHRLVVSVSIATRGVWSLVNTS